MIDDLRMLDTAEVASILHVHRTTVQLYREMGILKSIKTGKSYMYSQDEVKRFEVRFNGKDISNKKNILKTLSTLNEQQENERV